MRGYPLLLFALAILVGVVGSALGQTRQPSQVPRYVPATPTVSPYVNLLNRNGGAAANYYGLIRPLQRQATINVRQLQTSASQEQQIRAVEHQQQQFEQPTVKPTGTAGWFQNTGPTSPYLVDSHYYGQWPAQTRRRVGR